MENRKTKSNGLYQQDLFTGISTLKTKLVKRRVDFEQLFDGFEKMKAISYVISPDILMDFIDNRGYKEIEAIVGENLAESYRDNLKQKGIDVTERLLDFVEKGRLRIYVPSRTIHTKLYILEKESFIRIIQTSANLTLTAQEARNQINYSWYFDMPLGHPLMQQISHDYQEHLNLCNLFLDDLRNLIRQGQDTDKKQIIEAWLKGTCLADEPDTEMRGFFHQITTSVIQIDDTKEETVTILKLPESEYARKRIERNLSSLNLMPAGQNQVRFDKTNYFRFVYENHHVPFLIFSHEKQQLLLGLELPMAVLNEKLPQPNIVNDGLALLEGYLNTVDYGESPDLTLTKTSMFEALLYMFSTPFAHEYMKAKRKRFQLIDTRGPRFLYIFGPSSNGKTTFLRFSLKLITGRRIEPLSRQDFTKTRISNVVLTETAFPLVFDDVDPSRTPGIEDIFKSHWERMWREEYVWPQLVISSNTPRLKEWAKSRVKRIDFNVHFVPSEESKEKLAQIFTEENRVFKWFANNYIKHTNSKELASDDELHVARIVMTELYQYAGRPRPSFFPLQPIEKIYDPGKRDWQDVLFTLRKANIQVESKRKLITFTKDMQPWEINDYQGYLPQTVKHYRRGNTIIIENPSEFDKWLGSPQKRNIVSKIFGK